MNRMDLDGLENEYGQLDTVQYHLRQAKEAYENAQNGFQKPRETYDEQINWLDAEIIAIDDRMEELENILPEPEHYPSDAGRCE